jgi:hypothetical protein
MRLRFRRRESIISDKCDNRLQTVLLTVSPGPKLPSLTAISLSFRLRCTDGFVSNSFPCLNASKACTYGRKLFGASLTGVGTRAGGVLVPGGAKRLALLRSGSRLKLSISHITLPV